jgi:hypothetical protein
MAQEIIQKELFSEIKAIRKDLDYIKEHMVDRDMVLTSEEEKRLDESIKEHKERKSMSLEDFERNN